MSSLNLELPHIRTLEELQLALNDRLRRIAEAFANTPAGETEAPGTPKKAGDIVTLAFADGRYLKIVNRQDNGLPPGSSGETLRHNGSGWVASDELSNDTLIVAVNGAEFRQVAYAGTGSISMWRANGTKAAPTAVLYGEVIGTLGARGYGATTYPADNTATIEAVAAENHDDTHGGTDVVISTTPKLSVTKQPRVTVTSEGKGGVNDTTPTADWDVGGVIRSTAYAAPADGVGAEMTFSGTVAFFQGYDRDNAVFIETRLRGLPLVLNVVASPASPVCIGHNVINTDAGVLQVNGDVTPDIDSGGDLGTALCQWDDIRFTGKIYTGGTPGLTQNVALAKLTAGGADGAATFTNGLLVGYTAPT